MDTSAILIDATYNHPDWPRIGAACVDYLNLPSEQQNPIVLGKIYGQLAYISPWTLQFFEHDIYLPLIKSGKLRHEDLRTGYWAWRFGVRVGKWFGEQNANGQILSQAFYRNDPVYVNRLLSEFTGPCLLVGGALKDCGCVKGCHDPAVFYTVDIDNDSKKPDLVIHAGFLEHLYFFPTYRFDAIWFEHYTVAEMHLPPHKVLAQYDRMLRPKGVMIFQSNYCAVMELHAGMTHRLYMAIRDQLIQWGYKATPVIWEDGLNRGVASRCFAFTAVKPDHDTGLVMYSPLETVHVNRTPRMPVGEIEFISKIRWAKQQLMLL